MMDFPFPGDIVGDFKVESVDVHDEWGAPEGYVYGCDGAARAGGASSPARAQTSVFPASNHLRYGNPYQLWFRKPEIENPASMLCSEREGIRSAYLSAPELERFLTTFADKDAPAASDTAARGKLIEDYLEKYRAEIAPLSRVIIGSWRKQGTKRNFVLDRSGVVSGAG